MDFWLTKDVVYILLLSVLSLLIWIYLGKGRGPRLNLPPGPPSLPFLGYLPFLGSESHKNLSKLAQKYGGVFGMHVGKQYVLVINGFEAMKELSTKDEFQDRPPNYFDILEPYTNIVQVSGPVWKEIRNFHLTAFKNLGMGRKSTEQYVLGEIRRQVDVLMKKTEEPSLNMLTILEPTFHNIILTLLYGKSFDSNHPYSQLLPEALHALSMKVHYQEVSVVFPLLGKLKSLLNPKHTTFDSKIGSLIHIIRKEIEEHKANLDKTDPKDFIDYYLMKMEDDKGLNDTNNAFNDNSLVGNLIMGITAGSVTTHITSVWFLMLLALHQDIQERCYQEIIDTLGPDRDPEITDKENLPYTCAAIAESQRLHSISFLNLLRQCNTSGAKIRGFDVPKGTVIVQNLWALNFNEKLWPEPERFDPCRHLTNSGQALKIPGHLIPFSLGKRMCPGANVASQVLFLFIVCLIRRFKFLPPEGGISMEHSFMFNVVPAKPFLRLEKRTSE